MSTLFMEVAMLTMLALVMRVGVEEAVRLTAKRLGPVSVDRTYSTEYGAILHVEAPSNLTTVIRWMHEPGSPLAWYNLYEGRA